MLTLSYCISNLKIARRYELERNNTTAELKVLRWRLGDITNDDAETPHTSKCKRTHSLSPDSEDEGVGSRANDSFVFQSGHKFFLIYGPWVHLGDDLFETKFNEAYNNDESKAQGQLHIRKKPLALEHQYS